MNEGPSYLSAISFRCHLSSVSGVTMVARSPQTPPRASSRASGWVTSTLVISEAEPAAAELSAKDPIFLAQILHHVLLFR